MTSTPCDCLCSNNLRALLYCFFFVGSQASFLNAKEVAQKAGKERINDFLRNHVCYDLLKHSGKVGLVCQLQKGYELSLR